MNLQGNSLKGKPNPYGLKVFVVDFFIYQGSGDKIINDSAVNDIKKLDTGSKEILRFSESLPPCCNLYMGKYFTSVPLLDILHYKNHCQGTGTLRKNNILSNVNFKTDIEMKRLDRGSVDEKVRNDAQDFVVKWFDNILVGLTSSAHGKHYFVTCKR
ncbi:DDE_Tnp_1_7 domain-containing protein [Nephila pilipes]|uniref:DDE_Tnp_1_7 domain-containing protein n=1 Tax=Nephila pilipes TaxID=299642 RepID=A0A8X6TIE5_NEPPI|nr:DDE_Tnp_1_7 domain-containing protein [Nephila pilipes]